MLVAKVHGDRARADQTASAAGTRKVSKKKLPIRDINKSKGGEFSGDRADVFRANRNAAAAFSPRHDRGSVALGDTRRKRSIVVAMVKKRVEMLHMNVICREITQVLVSVNGYSCVCNENAKEEYGSRGSMRNMSRSIIVFLERIL